MHQLELKKKDALTKHVNDNIMSEFFFNLGQGDILKSNALRKSYWYDGISTKEYLLEQYLQQLKRKNSGNKI